MNIIVIGLGSMGKRRIRLIKKIDSTISIFGIDNREDRRDEVSKLYSIKTYSSIENINGKVDAAFICTSPLSHANLINLCLTKKMNVFTEINLVSDMYDDNIKLAHNNSLILFLSSTPLYKREMQKIKEICSPVKQYNYIYHIGQYLPDWHPWETYNDYFISDKRTNGCREIMAIELPWIIDLFGKVVNTNVMKNKITKLSIDYYDNYIIQLEHDNGNKGVLVIDVVSPKAVRKLEIYSEEKYVSWNGTPDSLIEYDKKNKRDVIYSLYDDVDKVEGYSDFIVENAYEEEIRSFFKAIRGNEKDVLHTFKKDKEILKLIDAIEG